MPKRSLMTSKSYSQLLDENAALKLLLEEAHVFGNHTWSCSIILKTSKVCDCWYGKSVELLVGAEPLNLTVSLKDLQCRICGHKAHDHAGTLSGSGVAVCCICNCSCLKFVPKDQPS
jgi:hypothetical protein